MADNSVSLADGDHVMREPDAASAVQGIVPLDVVVVKEGKSDGGEPKAKKRTRSRLAEKASGVSQDQSLQPGTSRRPVEAKADLDRPVPSFTSTDIRDRPGAMEAALVAYTREENRQRYSRASTQKERVRRWQVKVLRDTVQTKEIVSQAEIHYASMQNGLNYAYTRFDTFSNFVHFFDGMNGRDFFDQSFGRFLDWKRADGFVTLSS